MRVAKTIAYKAETAESTAKGMAGRLSGSRRLRREGRIDHAKHNVNQAGTKIKDAFRN